MKTRITTYLIKHFLLGKKRYFYFLIIALPFVIHGLRELGTLLFKTKLIMISNDITIFSIIIQQIYYYPVSMIFESLFVKGEYNLVTPKLGGSIITPLIYILISHFILQLIKRLKIPLKTSPKS